MIKIAVVHPSFGRPSAAFQMYRMCMERCDHPEQIEYLVGLDDNDLDVAAYRCIFSTEISLFGRLMIDAGESRTNIQAINRLATRLSPTTELIVAGEDDREYPLHWDTSLLSLLEGVDNFNTPRLIGVSDGLREYGTIMQLIVNRGWYARLGYLLCPEYTGLVADLDFNEVATRLGCIIHAPQLLFLHKHYCDGHTAIDATYLRNNNERDKTLNEDIFYDRKIRNFDV